MKFTVIHFPAKAGAVFGFLTLAAVGWNLASVPDPAENGDLTLAQKPQRDDRQTRCFKSTGPATLAAKRLDAIRSAGTQESRLRATFALANSLSSSEITAWLNGGWFTVRGGPEQLLFRNILLARWTELDPESLLVWSFKNDNAISRNIFATWINKEPQRVIDFFKSHPDETNELDALGNLASNHPTLALQRLLEMANEGLSNQAVGNLSIVLRGLAEKSPAALETALDTLTPELRKQAESALCSQRLVVSFSTEIRALWDRPDGWKVFQDNIYLGLNGKIFDELANMPPAWRTALAQNPYNFIDEKNAAKWLDADLEGIGFSAAQVKRLRISVVESMASRRPDEALKRIGEVDLSSDDRKNVIFRLMNSFGSNREKAMSFIARLFTAADREQAQETLDAIQNRQKVSKPLEPAEWLEKISGINTESDNKAFMNFISMNQWGDDKIAEVNEQFKVLPDDKKRQTAQVIANVGYSDCDTILMAQAVRYLVVNPMAQSNGQNNSDSDPVRMASRYAAGLAIKDPAAATDWVSTLPAGDAKLWAQKNVAKNWAAYDPKAAAQWVASLPVDSRNKVQTFMKNK